MTSNFLCSYRPLAANGAGQKAIGQFALPPFIDGSCRREPDFQAAFPSISALCRAGTFAPKLRLGDRVAYITTKSIYELDEGWALVALLTVLKRFDRHSDAADWYRSQGLALPSNCLVPGNEPVPFAQTNKNPPPEIKRQYRIDGNDERALRRWDATYAVRARKWGTFLTCRAEHLELWNPPILRGADFGRVLGGLRGTQTPPYITDVEYAGLATFAAGAV